MGKSILNQIAGEIHAILPRVATIVMYASIQKYAEDDQGRAKTREQLRRHLDAYPERGEESSILNR